MSDVSVERNSWKQASPSLTATTAMAGIRLGAGALSAMAPNLAARWLERLFVTPPRHATPAREAIWMEGSREAWIAFDEDRKMPVYSWGEGPTVLLVHGFSGRGSQMGAFVRPLLAQGCRVVIFDFVAHGRAGGRQTSLPEMAEALAVVARHLGPLHGIVAHSIGSAATAIALSRGIDVHRVVCVSPPDDPEAYLFRLADSLGFSSRVTGRTKRRLETRFGLRFEKARGADLVPLLTQQALIVHDCGDRVVPMAEGKLLHNRWAGSQFHQTRDLGHSRILRDASVVARSVEFLSKR